MLTTRQMIKDARDNVLRIEALFYGSHRAHGNAAEIECVKRARPVAGAAAVMPHDETPRRGRIPHETESIARLAVTQRRILRGRTRTRRDRDNAQLRHLFERMPRQELSMKDTI